MQAVPARRRAGLPGLEPERRPRVARHAPHHRRRRRARGRPRPRVAPRLHATAPHARARLRARGGSPRARPCPPRPGRAHAPRVDRPARGRRRIRVGVLERAAVQRHHPRRVRDDAHPAAGARAPRRAGACGRGAVHDLAAAARAGALRRRGPHAVLRGSRRAGPGGGRRVVLRARRAPAGRGRARAARARVRRRALHGAPREHRRRVHARGTRAAAVRPRRRLRRDRRRPVAGPRAAAARGGGAGHPPAGVDGRVGGAVPHPRGAADLGSRGPHRARQPRARPRRRRAVPDRRAARGARGRGAARAGEPHPHHPGRCRGRRLGRPRARRGDARRRVPGGPRRAARHRTVDGRLPRDARARQPRHHARHRPRHAAERGGPRHARHDARARRARPPVGAVAQLCRTPPVARKACGAQAAAPTIGA